MTKLQFVKLLEIRGITELERGQSIASAIADTGGEATYDELLKVMQLCAVYYNEKIEKLETEKSSYEKKVKAMERQVAWLSCLNAAGVDNWDGSDYAYELWEEDYLDKYGEL